jgi:membrane associated rhomboid family serine protease
MVIIGINVLVWLMVVASGGRGSKLVDKLSLIPAGRCDSVRSPGGYYPGISTDTLCTNLTNGDGSWHPGVADGAYWQLISSAFLHEQVWHIGFNMLALWVLGPQLELAIGRARFIALYLLSALAGSTFVLWAAPENSSTLGASGAVFGLMGALLVLAFKVGGNYQQILMWIGINAVLTFTISGISWQGHLGGFLGGLAIAGVLVYAPRRRRAQVQVAGLSVLGLAVVAAVVVRVMALS